jgi:hypothetical protein
VEECKPLGAGSAVYLSGAQALLVDISSPSNRARVLGFNQAAARPHLITFSLWNNEPFVPKPLKLSVGTGIEDMVSNPVRPVRTAHFDNLTDRLAESPTGSRSLR